MAHAKIKTAAAARAAAAAAAAACSCLSSPSSPLLLFTAAAARFLPSFNSPLPPPPLSPPVLDAPLAPRSSLATTSSQRPRSGWTNVSVGVCARVCVCERERRSRYTTAPSDSHPTRNLTATTDRRYLASTAVVMCEVLKWTISCFMCINEDKVRSRRPRPPLTHHSPLNPPSFIQLSFRPTHRPTHRFHPR